MYGQTLRAAGSLLLDNGTNITDLLRATGHSDARIGNNGSTVEMS